ncbi:hypothetical protein NXF25_019030 [Crotalus adamanteus]|uniref:Retrotransposon gag domain-containing protein n=1 Tax=Crotalus adamanteus TaxID=8729 RepID=A0AAW1B0U3_CROAD
MMRQPQSSMMWMPSCKSYMIGLKIFLAKARKANVKVRTIKQGKRPVAEYIQEFCNLVARVRGWLEHMLVYQF